MELTIESIHEVEDPYQTFVDSIKNKETFRKYKPHLYRFLKLVPNSIYSENLGEIPFDDSIETLSKFFRWKFYFKIWNKQRNKFRH